VVIFPDPLSIRSRASTTIDRGDATLLTRFITTLFTTVILLVLLIAWIAILVPPLVRGRGNLRSSRSTNSTVDFATALGKLDPERFGKSASVTALRGLGEGPIKAAGHSLVANAGPPTAPRATTSPSSTDEAHRRRRHVVVAMASFSVATLLLAVTVGGLFVVVHVLSDMALLGFVMAVAQRQQLANERNEKVRPIRPQRSTAAVVSHAGLLDRKAL